MGTYSPHELTVTPHEKLDDDAVLTLIEAFTGEDRECSRRIMDEWSALDIYFFWPAGAVEDHMMLVDREHRWGDLEKEAAQVRSVLAALDIDTEFSLWQTPTDACLGELVTYRPGQAFTKVLTDSDRRPVAHYSTIRDLLHETDTGPLAERLQEFLDIV